MLESCVKSCVVMKKKWEKALRAPRFTFLMADVQQTENGILVEKGRSLNSATLESSSPLGITEAPTDALLATECRPEGG